MFRIKIVEPKKILLVDDDEMLAQLYSRKLASGGYDVVTCKSGEEALGSLSTRIPDLLLLDVMMPRGMNGFDLMERLKEKERWRTIPVILLSNLEAEKETGLAMGALEYILKSKVTPEDVLQVVNKHFAPTPAPTQ